MDSKEIITLLKKEIAEQGISKYRLTQLSGVAKNTLSRFQEDNWGQQIETLCKIADAVGMEVTIKGKKS